MMRGATRLLAVAALLGLCVGPLAAATVSVSVQVTDRANGTPLAKTVVVLFAEGAVKAVGRTNAEGAWGGQVAPTKRLTAVASKGLYVSAVRVVDATETATVQIHFELQRQASENFKRLGRIVGFVRGEENKPVGNATLVLLKKGKPVGVAQPENATGVYELQFYPPGKYTVMATAPGYRTLRTPVQEITAGGSLWLDINLQRE